MARYIAIAVLLALLLVGAVLFIPSIHDQVRALIRPEPPAQLTPLALTLPQRAKTNTPLPTIRPSATARPIAATIANLQSPISKSPTPSPEPPTASPPSPIPSPQPVTVNGQTYDAYIPAASKEKQTYKYSCELDSAWVILQTYGIDTTVDDMLTIVGTDSSVEPYIEDTAAGHLIHGGDITTAFSGDYKTNFLARSTGDAMRKVFEHYGLPVKPVHDRAEVETALRTSQLVWMKTTVDFKPWRPATWVLPDGRTRQTVLGNDHAVVAMGFSARGVVIRDVLGPTSSNWQRPYEYEVAWDTFLAAWGAQEFDGLAVASP